MNSGVIVLAPPWPRTGSSNTFAAQTAAHGRRGARVLLMLTPLWRWHSRSKTQFWRDAVYHMKLPGVETVAYPRADRGKARSYCQWLLAGRDDCIAITARYAASARLPSKLAKFLNSTRVDLIQANHIFSIGLAQRIAELVRRMQGHRPHILLDTHDVQSDVYVRGGRTNWHSGRVDGYGDLLATELALCARADTLIHHCQSDFDFFTSRLPDKAHELIVPTLHPDSETELMKRRGRQRRAAFDFLYLGNNHEANLETVRWLLREVLPLSDVGDRVCIVGTIGQLVRDRDPGLFSRYERLFLGEVSSVYDFYTAAKVILAPARAGTGTSIKLIEALCAGKPILTTNLGIRGLPREQMVGEDIHVHDAAGDFADAMTALTRAPPQAAPRFLANAGVYDRVFSNRRYFAALDDVIERRLAESATEPVARARLDASADLVVSSP
jgi:glycosyltransferase involved in cell wall biosynthesis